MRTCSSNDGSACSLACLSPASTNWRSKKKSTASAASKSRLGAHLGTTSFHGPFTLPHNPTILPQEAAAKGAAGALGGVACLVECWGAVRERTHRNIAEEARHEENLRPKDLSYRLSG